jgi:hypothetical protein
VTELSIEPQRRSPFLRLAILLLIVIVLLGLTNLLIIGVRMLDRPGRPSSGQLLYATTFDAYNEEWAQFEGQMSSQIAKGSLVIAIGASRDGAYSWLNHDFSDFDVRVDAKRLAATDEYDEIGLLFRYLDPKNYYMFKIRGDSAYRVERVKDGTLQVLSEWHASPAVLTGLNTINQLRVIGRDGAFQFFANDQQLILCPSGPQKQKSTWNGEQCLSNNKETSTRLLDDTFDYGKIGVGVFSNSPGIEAAFDNVLVYGPDRTP